ncbi:MAG: type II toxin-antitoxin system VapC family toxin [Lewinellaceae bacterium]|nr:type II toxin-antitoxin system VapC family toxin [Phaeodactylibacter sp.]MCB0614150.1 type II toxin-antitoxin system VapC family toxin [Phaeodactylibacter sp.]MCB9349984.1 type II toxin-antitoxin system VapC family toxin [Lewinellaceae bacterium]
MKIILDVSAAFAVVTGAPGDRQFLPSLESAAQVSAPDLFYSEATNAAWKFHHIEGVAPDESLKLAEKVIGLVDIFFPTGPLWRAALELACRLEHPAYDCYYLVLAQQLEATLLTSDKRLVRKAKILGISTIGPEGPTS